MLKHNVTPRGCESMERVVTFFGGMYFHTFSIHLMGHFLTHKRNLLHRTKMEKLIFVRAPYFLAPLNYIFFRHSLMHSGAKKENLLTWAAEIVPSCHPGWENME